MTRMPTLFVSHGSPMHALEPGAPGGAWSAVAQRLSRPRAILIASAHWESRMPMLGGTAQPETIHDFHGFPEALYRIQYPAHGDPALAEKARKLLAEAGLCAGIDGMRGLDHGAWTPLLYMYPEADVPVLQISVQPDLGTAHHLALGNALSELTQDGVLIIGSGHMTHNLREAFKAMQSPVPTPEAPYAATFSDWIAEKLKTDDRDALTNYRLLAPNAVRAHPTEEHYLPLLVAMGAAGMHPSAERVYAGIELGSLSMDAWLFHAGEGHPSPASAVV